MVEMNKSISSMLFNFLTSKREGLYSFENYYENLKFIDLISYNFNHVIDDISCDQINKLTNYNESFGSSKNKILTFDVNYVNSSKSLKTGEYIKQLSKCYNCKIFSESNIYNKTTKNNILKLDLYVKNFEYRNILENLTESMSEKIKQR